MKNNDQSKTDEYFKSNISNLISFARNKSTPKFSSFLDERQQLLAVEVLNSARHKAYKLYGGTANCERLMLGVFPENGEIDESLFPITPLKVDFSEKQKLSHRDFLGSLMGLQVKREAVGDILIDNSFAIILVHDDISDFILYNLDKVSKTSVKVSKAEDISIDKKLEFEQITGTVSSLRLDCVVALLLNKSRSIAVEVIEQGLVKLNCVDTQNVSKQINENDIIVIRGKGKFILEAPVKKTKKDRLFITVNKLV